MFLSKSAVHNRPCTWARWCRLFMALVLGACYTRADTIKLKDGTAVEGSITAENDTTLSIYIERSGGTITQTRVINKADIASVVRWTPEQKAEWQMNHDYISLQRYQLNPTSSYALEYYNQIIDGVFRKFLTQHPNSPHAAGVNARIAEWKAERDLVAAGNVKFHGRWSPAAEVADQLEHERTQQLARQNPSLKSQTTTATQPAKSQPTPQAPVSSSDALTDIVAWAKNNWMGMTMVVLAIVFLITRFFKD